MGSTYPSLERSGASVIANRLRSMSGGRVLDVATGSARESVGREPAQIAKSLGDICHISRNRAELRGKVSKYKPDELSMGDYMKHIIGTPEECVKRINSYRDLGISELVLQFPSVGAGDRRALMLFAETVIPTFQGQ